MEAGTGRMHSLRERARALALEDKYLKAGRCIVSFSFLLQLRVFFHRLSSGCPYP